MPTRNFEPTDKICDRSLTRQALSLTNQARLVSGVASKYGKDSREYELAGAVRKSERARKATITRLKSSAEAKATSTEIP
ncbi:MAG: hypothetical protein RMX68_008540 [Aulosira sp. ZfuVER01]|nr:hypothetical protein [Aulosira sp. ZfuVER01]MDZ7997412.1 hypothetical protein [Aulosira sp. DedVER01a]MDZ8054559.1 hypothetical protein [Aulosira sp. ZfuCHP01]